MKLTSFTEIRIWKMIMIIKPFNQDDIFSNNASFRYACSPAINIET